MAKAKGEHNSFFFIIQTFVGGGPLQFELPKFHCIY